MISMISCGCFGSCPTTPCAARWERSGAKKCLLAGAGRRVPAIGFCQGSPLRNEIESRDASRMSDAVDLATEAVARRFGSAAIDGKIQAHVVSARK